MATKFISASWPYLHTVPGIHNAIPILAADAFARFCRLEGHDVVFTCGADEYGARMELMAQRKGLLPQNFADQNYETLRSLLVDWLEVDFSWFARTTDIDHQAYVKKFLNHLEDSGHIYQKLYTLPYCQTCMRILPDRFVEGKCPQCECHVISSEPCKYCKTISSPLDLKEAKCAFCEQPPVAKDIPHWFFRMDRVRPLVEKYFEKANWFSSEIKRYAETASLHFLDFPVTRDIAWGVDAPFPNAGGKTIFSWVDSLLGNLSILDTKGRDGVLNNKEVTSTYFMGWDNIPFYSVLLPSLLLARDKDHALPINIVAHHYLTFLGQPCSKSTGNGIWMDHAKIILDNADCWRYYLLRRLPLTHETNFEWNDFVGLVEAELIGVFSKLVEQTFALCSKNDLVLKKHDQQLSAARDLTQQSLNQYMHHMNHFEIPQAVEDVLALARAALDHLAHIKSSQESTYSGLFFCQYIAVMLFPLLPQTAQKIWATFRFDSPLTSQRWGTLGQKVLKTNGTELGQMAGPLFETVEKNQLIEKFHAAHSTKEQKALRKVGEYCEKWWER